MVETEGSSWSSSLLAVESLTFFGHPAVRATHSKTFEVTKERDLTSRGDCIIGVRGDKSCRDFSQELKKSLKEDRRVVKISLQAGGMTFDGIWAKGDPRLILENEVSVVVRRSEYICPRTLAVRANMAAADLPRVLVALLRDPETTAAMTVMVYGVG